MAVALGGCVGIFDEPGGGAGPGGIQASLSGMRRLSRTEYDNTLRDLLGDTSASGALMLPEDVADPFDNDFTTQIPSAALIDAAETLAEAASARLLADTAKRDALVGCTPSGPGDTACLTSFVRSFGRRVLRRPLADDEVTALVGGAQPLAVEDANFYTGVDTVIQTLLQHPEFLYRIETGTAVDGSPGLYRLGDFEIATRLSYLLVGTTPDDALLDTAQAGNLHTPDQVRAAAQTLLARPEAQAQIERFHALWLGYHSLPEAPDLATPMQAESAALIDRVVFTEQRPWTDLFRATDTFVDPTLAAHYGLPAPTGSAPGWVPYGATGRQGLLSHGTFLSVAGKFGDTSPTRRGILIRTRLLCQVIPPPPPNVNVDQMPTSPNSNCKWDRYAAHRTDGSCNGCHSLTDPVGFGLERFDQTGQYRETDTGHPECPIAGDGEVVGLGTFNGPAALEDLLLTSGTMQQCMVTQIYRFATGHHENPEDAAAIAALATAFENDGERLDSLLLDLVGSPGFGYRLDTASGGANGYQ